MRAPHILIVDDDAGHRHLLACYLQRHGDVTLTLAGTSAEFRHFIRQESFDCAVIDYHLAGDCPGNELVQELSEIQPDCSAIVVSGINDQQVVVRCLRSGSDDFVNKTDALSGKNLWQRVMIAVSRRRDQRRVRRLRQRRERHLLEMAETDPLTETLNRRGVERYLSENGRSRLDRRNQTAVLLIDIDHFKAINDQYGHPIGDEVLRGVAGLMRSVRRQDDLLARWGGEEFLLIQPGTTLAATVAWAESLREAIADSNMVTSAGTVGVTISCGISLSADGRVDEEDISRADAALYDAKGRGRNGVSLWESIAFAEAARASRARRFEGRLHDALGALKDSLGTTQREHLTVHSRSAAAASLQIAQRLPMGDDALAAVYEASLAHDLGKVAVPEAVLAKPGPLNAAEGRLMRRHPMESAHLARSLGASRAGCTYVAHCRDRFDDPDTTPCLLAATVGVADAYAAMTARRAYQPHRSPVQALAELRRMGGRQFDPRVVEAACVALAPA